MAAAHESVKPVKVHELETLEGSQILDQMIETGIKPRDESGRQHARDLVRNFVEQLVSSDVVRDANAAKTINMRIAAIDEVLSKQVDKIIHHPQFQKLEASWRGLHKLVMNSETSDTLKIRVLNASKKELAKDFAAAAEFTESALWKKIYEYQFGLYGGDPFGSLIGDYEFDKGPQDVQLLTSISEVAAASHAPFISAPAAEMFAMKSFTQMPDPRDLARIFDKANPENTKWLSFRAAEDSRFIGLVL